MKFRSELKSQNEIWWYEDREVQNNECKKNVNKRECGVWVCTCLILKCKIIRIVKSKFELKWVINYLRVKKKKCWRGKV